MIVTTEDRALIARLLAGGASAVDVDGPRAALDAIPHSAAGPRRIAAERWAGAVALRARLNGLSRAFEAASQTSTPLRLPEPVRA